MIPVSNSLFSMYRYNTFSRLPRDGNVLLESLLFAGAYSLKFIPVGLGSSAG